MTDLSLGPNERITITKDTPEELICEVTYGPSGSPPPPHFHPDQDERFTILGGKIAANLGPEGQRIRLRANTVSGDVAVVHAAAPADPAPEAPAAAQEPGRGTEH